VLHERVEVDQPELAELKNRLADVVEQFLREVVGAGVRLRVNVAEDLEGGQEHAQFLLCDDHVTVVVLELELHVALAVAALKVEAHHVDHTEDPIGFDELSHTRLRDLEELQEALGAVLDDLVEAEDLRLLTRFAVARKLLTLLQLLLPKLAADLHALGDEVRELGEALEPPEVQSLPSLAQTLHDDGKVLDLLHGSLQGERQTLQRLKFVLEELNQ